MISALFKKSFISASILIVASYSSQLMAHSAGATIDGGGGSANATDLAQVFCYDDGNGQPDHLVVQIKDLSPPVSGLLLSAQIYGGNKMTNVTDTVSGDGAASNEAVLVGGEILSDGVQLYYISVSKTKAGVRNFEIIYHCMSSFSTHVGTDITVLQVQ